MARHFAQPRGFNMSVMSTTSFMSFAEFEALADVEGKRELIDGEVIVMPPRVLADSWVAKQVLLLLLARLDKKHVWPVNTG